MEHLITKSRLLALLLLLGIAFTGCYNDSEEELYPEIPGSQCDLTSVTYSSTIAPIMATNCNSCHSGASASAGVVTNTYEGLSIIAKNGKLYGSVSHASVYSAMPQGGAMLSNCNLDKIKTWVDAGALNN